MKQETNYPEPKKRFYGWLKTAKKVAKQYGLEVHPTKYLEGRQQYFVGTKKEWDGFLEGKTLCEINN